MPPSSSKFSLRRFHLQIFIACLLVVYGITFRKLHLETIETSSVKDVEFPGRPLNENIQNVSPKQHKSSNQKPQKTEPLKTATRTEQQEKKENSNPRKGGTKKANTQKKKDNNDHVQLQNHNNSTIEFTEFTHHEGGVIVTKVHGPHQLPLLQQSMCLLHQAYNQKVQYDIVVFSTVPISDNETSLINIRDTIAPVKLTVVVDNEGLVNEINNLSPIRRKNFLSRCNATLPEEITWDSECYEDEVGKSRIRYNWQAEFRSWHIWNHEALSPYKYMMWIDTDAFCTEVWDRDPMAIAMQQNLAIYFVNYPQGRAKIAQPKVKEVFGSYLCGAHKSQNGVMYSSMGEGCGGSQLWTVHGFFHITNLDFFRQPKVMHWAETMIGDCFLCRRFDDQLAVTVPSMILAPERSWDMYRSGVRPHIFHNHRIDGKRNRKVAGFLKYWKENAEAGFPEAWNTCEIVAAD